MGTRRERRIKRSAKIRLGASLGSALFVLFATVAAASLGGTSDEASADNVSSLAQPTSSSSTSTTSSTTTTTTRPAVNAALAFVPANSGTGRRIIYCNSCQRLWIMEDDTYASASYQVSGRRGTPDPGTYAVIRKLDMGNSKRDPSLRLPWFVGFTMGRTTDIGFHGIPLRPNGAPIQSDAQLGEPLSAGCIRQDQVSAKALFEWAPIGTTVVVTP